MPTIFSHSLAAATIGRLSSRRPQSSKFWMAVVVCACLPDIDVVGFSFGVRYGDFWGHRGFTHSLLFAALTGVAAAWLASDAGRFTPRWWRLAGLLAIVTASHGALDALTDGGLGIAFFSPFDQTRYFFPFRPLAVSPIGLASFLSARGLHVLGDELLVIGLPCLLLLTLSSLLRRIRPFGDGGTFGTG